MPRQLNHRSIIHPNNEPQTQILAAQREQEDDIVKTSVILVGGELAHQSIHHIQMPDALHESVCAFCAHTQKYFTQQNLVHGRPSRKRLGLRCWSRSMSISIHHSQVDFLTSAVRKFSAILGCIFAGHGIIACGNGIFFFPSRGRGIFFAALANL